MAKTVTFDVIARSKATGFDDTNKKLEQQQKQLHLISTAAVALAPALAPIGAAAVAAGAGLGALGATGLLAFEGIKKEMADGTPVGQKYTSMVGTLKGDLDTLERTAARGVLDGFEKGASSVHSLLPLVNDDTAKLSSKLGDIVSHVAPGFVRLFTDANPLLLQFADDLDKGAKKFDTWTQSSDGAKKFVAYAQKELPQVEQTVGALAKALIHVVEAVTPLGGGSLTTIRLFADTINHIPIGVLQALAPALVGLKVASTVSAGLGNLTSKLTDFAGGASTAGKAATALSDALPLISAATPAVILGLETINDQWTKIGPIIKGSTVDATDNSKAFNALADSFWATNPAATATNAALLKYGLTAQGAKDITTKYGISTEQLSSVLTSLGATQGQLGSAMLSSATYTTGLTGAQAKLVGQVESSTTQIGYLNTALDKFSNFALDAEQQELKLKDSFASATQQLKGNGSALNDQTVKGRANKEWVLSEIQAINQHVSAVGKQTGSVKQATAALSSDEDGLRRAAKAAGLNTSQVNAMIKQYGLTPKKLTTIIQADTATALSKISGVQQALNDLQSYKVLQIVEVTSKISARSAGTNLARRAGGGPVTAGVPYIVGENRPELFVPSSNGRIEPRVPSSGGGVGSAVGMSVTINMNGAIIGGSMRQAARALKKELEELSHGGEPLNVKIAGS